MLSQNAPTWRLPAKNNAASAVPETTPIPLPVVWRPRDWWVQRLSVKTLMGAGESTDSVGSALVR
ncbi:hypothetical protein [Streptomyces yangpuensis]